jgi:hypothetical protein
MTQKKQFVLKARSLGVSTYISHRLLEKQPLTKRARRQAKKLFKKKKHSPWGYTRDTPQIQVHTQHALRWLAELDEQSQKLFSKNYSNLKDKDKTRVHESMNEGPMKERS